MSLELTQVDLRSLIQRLTMILKSFGCTTLLVSGQADTTNQGRKAVEEYVVDGMIRLHHSLEESTSGETTLAQNAQKGNSLEQNSLFHDHQGAQLHSRRDDGVRMGYSRNGTRETVDLY